MFKLDLGKTEEPEIKSPASDLNHRIIEKARKFQKTIYFCLLTMPQLYTVWITNWKILKEMGIPDHVTCLLRNLYAGQEATVRTVHETADWCEIKKGEHQGYILSPCLFN